MTGKNSMKNHYLQKTLYRHLNMEGITDADFALTKRVCKDFEIKDLEDYHGYHDCVLKVIQY